MLPWFILSVSHGNAVPEHGFSINRKILDANGYSISEETIIAIQAGKLCLSYQDFYVRVLWICINNYHAMTVYILQNNLYINKF